MLEHQAEFVNALRGGREMRERLFDTMERCYAHDFGNGRAGKGLYERLLSAVRAAGSPAATAEFRRLPRNLRLDFRRSSMQTKNTPMQMMLVI
jgi:hypothetical protein